MQLKQKILGALLVFLSLFMLAVPTILTNSQSTQPFSFGAAGDWGYDADIPWWQQNGGDFVLVVGDLGYTSNAADWCGNYVSQIGKPIIWVVGNHETDDSGPGRMYGSGGYIANCPPPVGFNFIGDWGIRYYFDYPTVSPNTRIIAIAAAIGGSEVDGNYNIGTENYVWTSARIDEAKSLGYWTIVMVHKNCISTGGKSCGEDAGSEDVWNLLLNKKVDLVLQGHDHNYQRTHQLGCGPPNDFQSGCIVDSDSTFTRGAGTVLVINGNGGMCCYGVSGSDSDAGYFAVIEDGGNVATKYTVSETAISADADGYNGFTFNDTFTIGGNPPPPPPPPPLPQCSDDLDNDGDSLIDYPADPGCTTITDNDEIDPVPPPEGVPLLIGWGGIGVGEVSSFIGGSSVVFPGEQVSRLEQVASLMNSLGYTAMRIMLDNSDLGSPYNAVNWQRTQTVAGYYDMWLVADDHAYLIPDEASWLSFWAGVIGDTTYAKVVWQPRNEPTNPLSELTVFYQDWIDQARGLGDNRWIVVSIANYQDLRDPNFVNYFPIVSDSLNQIFYGFHEYFFWQYHDFEWSIVEAEAFADLFDQRVTEVEQTYGRPVVITEFGADFGPCVGGCPPNVILTGSAGYTPITLAYVQRLINNLDNHASGRVGWIAWTAGDWTDTPGAGDLGALATNGWGRQITFLPLVPPVVLVGDLDSNCRIDIVDITIAAAAFGSTPAFPNWNPIADIDDNGIVNIIDLAMIAIHYGEQC